MSKETIKTIKKKNLIINRIIRVITTKNHFLLFGHKNPDGDCIASMVSFALLLVKFDKFPVIYLDGFVPKNLNYLLSICKYNSIKIINSKSKHKNNTEAVISCDTPKRSMLDVNKRISSLLANDDIVKIEIDHHIGGDSDYIGDRPYCLVTAASSTCELIGFLSLKLRNKKDLLKKYLISDPFSRNLVLSILTGIVGDTQKGQYIKSRREQKYYDIFSRMYNSILMTMTVRETNFTNIDQVFKELQHLSEKEEKCYNYINDRQKISESFGYVILNKDDMKLLNREFDEETIITVTKAIANQLAEKSGRIGLICYYDKHPGGDLIQFRMRRSHFFKNFDLRKVLTLFDISNGGGHEGAIGFRFPRREIPDADSYVEKLISGLEPEFASAAKK